MTPDTMKKQNTLQLALEAEDYEDDDIRALRDLKAHEARIEKEKEEARLRMERWARYFFENGICMEHDARGCNECRYYANGNCPSARYEKYY